MKEPTARQLELLDYIRGYALANWAPPTLREMCEHLGITINGVSDHLKALVRKGLVRKLSRHVACYVPAERPGK